MSAGSHGWRRPWGSAVLLVGALIGSFALSSPRYAAPQLPVTNEPEYLTPSEMKFSPDGQRLYVTCEGSDSVLAVDARSKSVVARAKVGHRPWGMALSPNGKTIYVSNEWSDTVSEIDAASFEVRRTLKTGWGPVGLTTDRAGKTLYVANGIGNDVSVVDLASGQEIKRFRTQRYPQQVALSRDGRRVYVSNVLPRIGPYDQQPESELLVIDAVRQTVAERISIPGVIELRQVAEAPAGLGDYLLVPFMRPKNLGPLIAVAQGWVVTHGIAVIRPGVSRFDSRPSPVRGRTVGTGLVPAQGRPQGPPLQRPGERSSQVTQVLLDDIDYYYAGGYGVAFTPNGRYALISSSEASVVTIIDTAKLARRLRQVPAEELANRLDSAQTFVVRRLPTGHDPRSIAISLDGRFAYIANRLDDSVTVVDLVQLKVASTIDLGGPKQITPLRRGEQLFFSAKYCFQGQFACGTCHPNSHLDGLAWNLETPQLGRDRVANRTLRGIKDTAPYKWNGRNPDLATQCGPRIAKFLFRSEGFNREELEAVITYLNNIPLAPNRHLAADGQLTDAQERGKQVYYRTRTNDGREIPVQNRCETCHPADTHYTNKINTTVKSANKYDTSDYFDTPQLDRVYENAPYLHNGQALTLEEIWTVFNNSDTHGVTSDMSKEQLNDMIEFLKTL